MTGTADRVEAIANALDQAQHVIAGIDPEQRTDTTPCASWDVATLVGHLMSDVEQFTVQAEGGKADYTKKADEVAAEQWSDGFASRASELVAAWRKAQSQDGIDMQIAELTLHTWDLEKATGQTLGLDPTLAEIGLATMRGMLKDEYRGSEADGKMFGPEVEVDADAGSYERLAAFAGRTP